MDSNNKAWDKIVKYDTEVDISEFTCGNNEMDLWFRRDAFEWHQHNKCTVYLALNAQNRVVGFYTLSAHSVQTRIVPQKVQEEVKGQGNWPCLLLGRFAVDKQFRGQGHLLLDEAIGTARIVQQEAGVQFLFVEAIDDEVSDWYEEHGFYRSPKNSRTSSIPCKACGQLDHKSQLTRFLPVS